MKGSCPHCGGAVEFDDVDLFVTGSTGGSLVCQHCLEPIGGPRDLDPVDADTDD